MDFGFVSTKELEEFREEVRTFIEEHAEKTSVVPPDPNKRDLEMWNKGRENEKLLGAKGWFAPGYPKEYGGGGLDIDRCVILAEEFDKVREERRWWGYTEVSTIMTGGIVSQGTEEQKKKYLTKQLTSEWYGFQCFTEPEAGTDEASMKATAIRDGDVYVVNGTKVFVGHIPPPGRPDFLYWLAVTNPDGPRHQNISAFFIPGDLPGIRYAHLDLIAAEGHKWEVICENVRCPADRLIGVENKGWLVGQATLDAEHGGGGAVVPRNKLILHLIDYCKTAKRNGKLVREDPRYRDLLVQLYIEYQVGRLWGFRNFAMAQGNIPRVRYTGTQTALHGKLLSPKVGKVIMEILGAHCLIDNPDLRALEGEIELAIRLADVTHIAGTPETQKIQMSRALGLGRSAIQAMQASQASR